MDFLSYYESAASATNYNDIISQQMADALQSNLGEQQNILAENLVGISQTKAQADTTAQAKELVKQIQSGEYGAAAGAAGGLILGRQQAYNVAGKVRDAFSSKAKTSETTGESTEATGESSEAFVDARDIEGVNTILDDTVEAAGDASKSATASLQSIDDIVASIQAKGAELMRPTGSGIDEPTGWLDNVGEIKPTETSGIQTTETATEIPITNVSGTATRTIAEEGGAIADPIESGIATPAFQTSIPAGGIRLGNTAEGSEEATEYIPEIEEQSTNLTERFAGQSVSASSGIQGGAGARDASLTESSNVEADSFFGLGAAEGTEMQTSYASASGAEGTAPVDALADTEASTGVGVGDLLSGASASSGIGLGEGLSIGLTEAGGAASAALDATAATLLAIPGADLLGGALLIGSVAAPFIIDAFDKKKEKKEKKKAKEKAEQAQATAQANYQQALNEHQQAISALNSNNHASITGGVEQKTGGTPQPQTF